MLDARRTDDWTAKRDALRARLLGLRSVLVAFSGGIDSAFVLAMAVRTLGRPNVLAVTARSPAVPARELNDAEVLAAEIGAEHLFLDTNEMGDARYAANPENRCYFCKTELYTRLKPIANARRLHAVVNGVNADDLGDYRPGLSAAAEHGIVAPLADCAITKTDLRAMAAEIGLSIADKPASPCLSSRVQYGEAITPEKLARIDAAETFLRSLGFRECRVRHHDRLARIEVPASEIDRLCTLRARVDGKLRELGYQYVAVDLRGFRSGSLNEVILGAGLLSRGPRDGS